MAKSCKRNCKRHNKTKRHMKHRMQRGGELAGNPPSAWGYGLGTMGDGFTQFMNALTLQPNQNGNINQSNNIVPVGTVQHNQNMPAKFGGRRKKYRGGNQDTGPMSMPVSVSMPVSMPPKTGGKNRRTRGGNVIAQAIVPASLVLMNNAFGKNSRKRH